jgi:hypothetical protein
MHGIGLEQDVRSWFEMPVPRTRVARNRIERALAGLSAHRPARA